MGIAGQDWNAFAASMLPALLPAYQQDGIPVWVTLAMAARESGVPTEAGSTYVVENNPWGLRPFAGSSQYPNYSGSNGLFVQYPTLTAAGTNLVVALGLGVAGTGRPAYSDPTSFLDSLEATGWDGPAPGSDGYAEGVLSYGPGAQAALQALGVDVDSGFPPGGGGLAGGSSRLLAAAAPIGGVLLLAGVALIVVGLGTEAEVEAR